MLFILPVQLCCNLRHRIWVFTRYTFSSFRIFWKVITPSSFNSFLMFKGKSFNTDLQDRAFGAAGKTVVVEELLEGEEVSVSWKHLERHQFYIQVNMHWCMYGVEENWQDVCPVVFVFQWWLLGVSDASSTGSQAAAGWWHGPKHWRHGSLLPHPSGTRVVLLHQGSF